VIFFTNWVVSPSLSACVLCFELWLGVHWQMGPKLFSFGMYWN